MRFMWSMLAARALLPPDFASARSSSRRSMPVISSSKLMPAFRHVQRGQRAEFRRLDFRRKIEVARIQNGTGAAQRAGRFQSMLQLAHVAGPGVLQEHVQRLRGKLLSPGRLMFGDLVEKMFGQLGDIGRTIPQRRHAQRDHVQAVVKILAEAAIRDRFEQVGVGSGDHAHVDGKRSRNCRCAGSRAPAARAAAWPAAAAASRRFRPGRWCRGAPVRTARRAR